jgi:hypothetical protein
MNMDWSSSRVFICGTTRNCEHYIDNVFGNIHKIVDLFADFRIIIAFDVSEDATLLKLTQHKRVLGEKMDIIVNRNERSSIRTENISNGRNTCLHKMREAIESGFHANYFIVMDMDDVCSGPMGLDVFKRAMDKNDKWDSISFNREGYYDIWALSIDEYVYSCWGWHCSWEVVDHTKKYIIDKLSKTPKDELVECRSAFNGFAIYKTDMFLNCYYDWRIPKQYMTLEELLHQKSILWNCGTHSPLDAQTNEPDCEHRGFHMMAIANNGARIRISPEILF